MSIKTLKIALYLLKSIAFFCFSLLMASTNYAYSEVITQYEETPDLTLKLFLQGNELFSDTQLTAVVSPYLKRPKNLVTVQLIRKAITAHYIKNGFVNSGAIIPPQTLSDNEVHIKIIEGYLTKITIENNQQLKDSAVIRHLKHLYKQPLNIQQLQNALLSLEQTAVIDRIHSTLHPGTTRGKSTLELHIEEAKPFNFNGHFSNHHAVQSGEYGVELQATHNNLSGDGNTLAAILSKTEGSETIAISYHHPLPNHLSTLLFTAEKGQSHITEQPLETLDIKARKNSFQLGWQYPLIQQRHRKTTFTAKVTHDEYHNWLLGIPFSLSQGQEQGEAHISALRLQFNNLTKRPTSITAFQQQLNIGIEAFNATNHAGREPDSQFTTLRTQAQHILRLEPSSPHTLLLKADLQMSDQPLLSAERFSLGGANTVRGYRKGVLSRDNGLQLTAEFSSPINSLLNLTSHDTRPLKASLFIDYGLGKNRHSRDTRKLYSWGLGLTWRSRHISAELYAAKALKEIDIGLDDALQDRGITFKLSYHH